jgi:hypothetical protein
MRGEKPYENVFPQNLRRFLLDGGRLEKPPTAPNYMYVESASIISI